MEAWVTLATNDTYALGALVLGQSLKRVGTTRKLHMLVTPGVTEGMKEHLARTFDDITEVDVLDSKDDAHLALIKRPELGITFTKFHCWLLTQYQKCVFLDADCLAIQNCDELFDYPELSAAPDIGWPDIFNSGVFIFVPSHDTFSALLQHSLTQGSFDGGDQGALNTFFNSWVNSGPSHRLPFTYNMSTNVVYTYKAAYKRFAKDIKIVHFLGAIKPWHHNFDPRLKSLQYRQESLSDVQYVEQWWATFAADILPHLTPEYINTCEDAPVAVINALKPSLPVETTDLAIRPSKSTASSGAVTEQERQLNWERGNVDYLGKDSWENIQKHLDEQWKK